MVNVNFPGKITINVNAQKLCVSGKRNYIAIKAARGEDICLHIYPVEEKLFNYITLKSTLIYNKQNI